MHRLFVYGTLKRGEVRSWVLAEDPDSHMVGLGYIDNFVLYDMGTFPAVVDGAGGTVIGEVWEVSDETWATIERIEGYPSLYQRYLVAATIIETSEYMETFVYCLTSEQVTMGKGRRLDTKVWTGHQ